VTTAERPEVSDAKNDADFPGLRDKFNADIFDIPSIECAVCHTLHKVVLISSW
jgi:hypothetical protein